MYSSIPTGTMWQGDLSRPGQSGYAFMPLVLAGLRSLSLSLSLSL